MSIQHLRKDVVNSDYHSIQMANALGTSKSVMMNHDEPASLTSLTAPFNQS